MKQAQTKAAAHPLSVRLDPKLLKRTEQYARKRKVGVTTALRMIVAEHLDYLDLAVDLDKSREWQAEEAWKTFKNTKEEDLLSFDDIMQVFDDALQRKKKK